METNNENSLREDKLYQKSQQGLDLLYNSIIELLKMNPNGLSTTEVARKLGIQSDVNGSLKEYLSYSLLGNLMNKKIVEKVKMPRKCWKLL
jgi:hypothetical protein